MKRYRIQPGSRVDLAALDPDDRSAFDGDKDDGVKAFGKLARRLAKLQTVFNVEKRHRLLVVFQAMDAAGKDGTARVVLRKVKHLGVRIASFKKPTEAELAHDYLWRVHKQVPADGEWVVFNRSHYEDVLVVRVHELVAPARWGRRYDHINDFERMLVDEGTTILKFFLHISKDEQRARLQERIDVVEKHWKFNPADLGERKLWPEYTAAYEEVLSRTSTEHAPWYVVPANRNWYRNLVVGSVLVDTLTRLDLSYPDIAAGYEGFTVE